jgi:hypothetical protein
MIVVAGALATIHRELIIKLAERHRLPAVPTPGHSTPIFETLVDCCARTASGHAAAPPRSVMNARRFIL